MPARLAAPSTELHPIIGPFTVVATETSRRPEYRVTRGWAAVCPESAMTRNSALGHACANCQAV
ncbi:hypothetical protein [Nocardia anaemiae]|uniref:hypothetical protein n=1 Tax=Nocardia anaemiae TaxID=263910 RepID=UPI0012F5257B|nr:hypothetical protein [Nocardia anaemiae]